MDKAKQWLERIHDIAKDVSVQRQDSGEQGELPAKIRIMNVCGGHERTISMAGIRGALPQNIELIPGPGCPVCVCPEEDIYAAITLALRPNIILVAFGDMLRVPANLPKRELCSLEQARAAGGDVRPVASPTEVISIAKQNPEKDVVFFAAGFETTMAPVAGMLASELPANLSILLSGRLTWPAVDMLLNSETAGFEALIAPGHVATIMGPEEWQFVPDEHNIPTAVAGFTPESVLAALYAELRQLKQGSSQLDNCYPEIAKAGGNKTARLMFDQILDVVDANWLGIGIIPKSGFALNAQYAHLDARQKFDLDLDALRKRAGEMPAGCDCAKVVLGKIKPNQCQLFGRACTPRKPVGPCMVSDEGACRIWWSSGIRTPEASMPKGSVPKDFVNG